MNLMDLFIKIGVDDQATSKIKKIASSLSKGLATAAKTAAAAVGTASTAIIALGKIGLDYNKQMETYTTNFEVMMGDAESAAKKVEELKEMGAKTPFEMGDLANATQTLLAFNVSADESTGVLQQLGDISLGNTQKLDSLTRAYGKMNAAQKVSLEDINMMIDAGFNPLLLVSESTGETMEEVYSRISKGGVSFKEIQSAINKATSAGGQFYKGMDKASQTTEGLISTLKDNATALIGEVYQPISQGLTETVLPAAIDAIGQLSEGFQEGGVDGMIEAAGTLIGNLLNAIVEHTPEIIEMAISLIDSLVAGLSENQEALVNGAIEIITVLSNGILDSLPEILQLGLDLIISLANGIAENLDELIPAILEAILLIVDTLTEPDTLSQLLDAALELIISLAEGLLSEESINNIIDAIFTLIDNLIIFLTDPENLMKLVNAAIDLVIAICSGLLDASWRITRDAGRLIKKLINKFKETDWLEVGKDVVRGILKGLKEMWENLKSWFSDAWDGLVGGVKSFLGIKSPSKVFAGIGKNMALGVGVGWDNEFGKIKSDVESSMNFDTATIDFASSSMGVSTGGLINGISSGIGYAVSETSAYPMTFKLVLPNGMELATYLLDPLASVAKANGTPILNPL